MDTEKELVVKGKLTIEDLNLYTKIHMKNVYVKMMLIVFIAFLVIFGVTFSEEQGGFIAVLLSALFGTIAVLIALFIFTKFIVRSSFNRNPLVKYEQTYNISEKEISIQSERGYTIYKWEDIVKVIESNGTFILYISRSMAIVIPQRFFTDESEITALKQLINKCTKCKQKLILEY